MTPQQLKNVFSSSEGRDVLKYLLWRLHFFNPSVSSEGDLALRNFGIELVQLLNPKQEEAVIESIIDSLIDLELKGEQDE